MRGQVLVSSWGWGPGPGNVQELGQSGCSTSLGQQVLPVKCTNLRE